MVRGRLIPTSYFRDPDVMSLSSGDVRLILVGLVLHADDYGRGLAHAVILGRDLDYPPDTIETALGELEQAELLQCYQEGKHRYYALTRWNDWQKLNKPTPSKLPAPPIREGSGSATFPGFSGESLENPGNSGERSPESESESESNGNRRRRGAAPSQRDPIPRCARRKRRRP
jgi:DNA-binding transcriptional ArsR family regulator